MDLLYMIEPWHWLVLGFLLMIAEIFIPTFASLWFGAAAVIVAALSWLLPISLLVQVILWLVLSIVFMFAWVKYAKPLSINRRKTISGDSEIIGETGMIVVKPTAAHSGRVRFSVPIFGDDEWLCRIDEGVVEVGDRVVVTGISGNELSVAATKQAPLTKQLTASAMASASDMTPNIPKASTSKLHLEKPSLDSVRLNKKFTDK
ncbi:NfeD family protein [Psychrobacter aestuarii]|uniref:NfeD-like C-terminal domain-containing protein n=1 Tax=Psychrobacter aestuarii TaxID=556327 RepID=A0ABP3FTF0_9GAMM|nr:NfeD family protein [Psychrobacter aestuarii]